MTNGTLSCPWISLSSPPSFHAQVHTKKARGGREKKVFKSCEKITLLFSLILSAYLAKTGIYFSEVKTCFLGK